jgi:hypothetical protein
MMALDVEEGVDRLRRSALKIDPTTCKAHACLGVGDVGGNEDVF